MTTTTVRDEATKKLADDLIGAAQELEKQAKRLKERAAYIRREGLTRYTAADDVVGNRRMHMHYDIKSAAERAIESVGYEHGIEIRTVKAHAEG